MLIQTDKLKPTPPMFSRENNPQKDLSHTDDGLILDLEFGDFFKPRLGYKRGLM